MREKITECFANIGFIVDPAINFELSEYLEDSVSFIGLIVELENEFNIEIPDEYLTPDSMKTFEDVCNMVETLLKTS
ncbi:acyl carrier protein [Fumia xinanensis]|uniref:Acyl carrier protein n=1 Tax=Fumia xinanensis TaxID=2763659 RepID=A0A926E0C9_9FIRM|nr:acyl carrier protein [Fumia xinanensis]MBC8559264.1 acyl carrier protein [Fumia xinanensis]